MTKAALFLLCVVSAAVLGAGLIRILLPTLRRHALSYPNARSGHRVPTPQGGGLAVGVATVAVAATAIWMSGVQNVMVGALVIATLVLMAAGAADDKWNLSAVSRLALQAFAMVVLIAALPAEVRLIPALPTVLERGLFFVGGLWFINAVNFMDGLDWMTVAEIVPISGALAVCGFFDILPTHATFFALALLGGMLGFAPYNRPVAKLFLGDVGSLPIGLITGALLFTLAAQGYLIAALILPMYYLADATLTLAVRLVRGERVWQAHRSHFYQRAVDGGTSGMTVVMRVFLLNLALAAIAAMTMRWTDLQWPGLAIAVILTGGLLREFARAKAKN